MQAQNPAQQHQSFGEWIRSIKITNSMVLLVLIAVIALFALNSAGVRESLINPISLNDPFTRGVLVGAFGLLAILILLPNPVSTFLTHDRHVMWIAFVVAAYALLWEFFGPVMVTVFANLNNRMMTFLVIGIVALVIGIYKLRRRNE